MDKNKRGVNIKEAVTVKTFVGFIVSVLWFMWLLNTEDITMFKWYVTLYLLLWAFMLIIGTNKGSIFELGGKLMKILLDPKLTNEDKFRILMSILKDWLGVVAHLGIIVEDEKKEKEEKKKKTPMPKLE